MLKCINFDNCANNYSWRQTGDFGTGKNQKSRRLVAWHHKNTLQSEMNSESEEEMKKVEELQNMHCFPFVSLKNIHRSDQEDETQFAKTEADFFLLKQAKVRELEKDPVYVATRAMFYKKSGVNSAPQIFQGCSFYFTGRMDNVLAHNSWYHLRNLAIIHGASICDFFAKKIVTHCICNNITLNKTYSNSAGKVKFVHPKWIDESISKGRKLDEKEYLSKKISFWQIFFLTILEIFLFNKSNSSKVFNW